MASIFDVAVIGGGIAGATAAHHAALAGVSVLHLTGDGVPGGLVANVGALDGFPSPAPVSGAALAERLAQDNGELGVQLVAENVAAIESGAIKTLQSAATSWRARQVIVATGARLKTLEADGAERLAGRGVSQCAWCDGGLYRGADVVVAGGGDAALSEALHLASYARRITIVTRGERFRARQSYVTRIAADERFELRWESEIEAVLGASGVEGVRVRDRASNTSELVACTGLFVFVGLAPNTHLLGPQAPIDTTGAALTDTNLETVLPGVFVVGAARAGYGGRLTNAVSEATRAAEIAASRCD